MNRTYLTTAVVLILMAIVLGAFGAHGLKEILPPEKLISFETGVRYQMYQGLGLLILGFNAASLSSSVKWVFRLILIGVLLFSGSIYLLALEPWIGVPGSVLGPVTPLGGVLMIAGWAVLLVGFLYRKSS